MQIRLVNPNSSALATREMTSIAREVAGTRARVVSTTSSRSVPLITSDLEMETARTELLRLFDDGLDPCDGVIVAAFGDPGVQALRDRLPVSVVGIGEAALLEAASSGDFALCTTTPALIDGLRRQAEQLGVADRLCDVQASDADPAQLMASSDALDTCLRQQMSRVARGGARSVIVAGGPLAGAARRLASDSPLPVVEPVPAAVRRLLAQRLDADWSS